VRRAAPILGLLAAACTAPAALEVQVRVEEPNLEAITVSVTRDDAPVIQCRLPAAGPGEGLCPFEAGAGRWEEPGKLAFILYGDPERGAEVSLEGSRGGLSVTATRAQVRLPSEAGERRVVELALVGRTRPRLACRLDLAPGLPPAERSQEETDQSGLVALRAASSARPIAVAPLQLLVSARNLLAVVLFAKGGEAGCTLTPVPLVDTELLATRQPASDDPRRWCNVRHGALGARAGAGGRTTFFAGLCANGAARLKLGAAAGRVVRVRERALEGLAARHSDPIFADTDGDGTPEALVVSRRADDSFELLRVWLDAGGLQEATYPMPALAPPPTVGPAYAPLAVAGPDGRDTVVIAGYRGASYVLEQGRLQELAARPSVRAPALAGLSAAPRRVGLVTVGPTAEAPVGPARAGYAVMVLSGRTWSLAESRDAALDEAVAPAAETRVVLGHLGMQADLQAVVFQAGRAHVATLGDPITTTALDVWGGNLTGGQRALLANLDGLPGSELLSYGADQNDVSAVRAEGGVLEGWEGFEFAGAGGLRHVLVTDLDGLVAGDEAGLRDAEVVSLADQVLEVVTLGPGSYALDDAEWPAAAHDAAGSGAWMGTRDPARP
jgi:hypothetical protein